MKSGSPNCELIVSSINFRRRILNKTAVVNDEGSNAMMSDFIAEQEKTMDDASLVRRITDFTLLSNKTKIVVTYYFGFFVNVKF
jgi:hypothetical protein